ncbi:unnamed protein product [Adineta ricciae]|uniref:EGF-like domain-containing protein n=1 Tax=Adineta ricciae TaxID=249248 RepID=A0A813VBP7_ADIRI|nr:unnamed protein product [Adineta ricciae]
MLINKISMLTKLSLYSSWDQSGITVANDVVELPGSSHAKLLQPVEISVTDNDVLYISNAGIHRIVVVHLNSITNNYFIDFGQGNSSGEFNQSYSVFIFNTSLYVLEHLGKRVQKMSLNGSNPVVVLNVKDLSRPLCLFINGNDNIYVSDRDAHKVLLFRTNATNGLVVAGNGSDGSTDTQLNQPYGIFVNEIETIYVADSLNHRIMKWPSGASSGIRVAGDGKTGNELTHVNTPTNIIVDKDGYMYIREEGSYSRITRWALGSHVGICIAACTGGAGNTANQVYSPHSLAFDSQGSLYVSDFGNHRVQKFELLNYPISYNQPKLCAKVTWSHYGIVFANATMVGQTHRGLFIDSNDTIYASHSSNNQILIWSGNNNNPERKLNTSLFQYSNLFVTLNGDIYFQRRDKTYQIAKITTNSTISLSKTKFSGNCFGLFIDIRNHLYCSLGSENRVVKIPLDGNNHTVITIAGNKSTGSQSNQLSDSRGIFVDIHFNLYVADKDNDRIQFFRQGELEGTIVAGKNIPSGLNLHAPSDVILDGDGFLYIADTHNHRIIQVRNDNTYWCIIGCQEPSRSLLERLYSLRFDSRGNLYVAHEHNHRIKKFNISNSSCVFSMTSEHITTITTDLPETSQSANEHGGSTIIFNRPLTTGNLVAHSNTAPSLFFVARLCEDSPNIGPDCMTPGTICEIQRPCLNDGNCTNLNNNQDYNCSCSSNFTGKHCETDQRICKETTCLNNGNCSITSDLNYNCTCTFGYEGMRCESRTNFCSNITCYNKGVCRSLSDGGYLCQCLSGTFGKHCENIETRIQVYQAVSRSIGYIGILALICVALFVIIMDILKYCFGINPTRREQERLRRERRNRRRKPVIQRFVYVNASSSPRQRTLSPIVEETSV